MNIYNIYEFYSGNLWKRNGDQKFDELRPAFLDHSHLAGAESAGTKDCNATIET